MSYFNITPSTATNASKRVRAVYALASKPAPAQFVPKLRAHMAGVPDAKRVALTLAADAYQAPAGQDPAAWWADAQEQMVQALASDALRTALVASLDTQERSAAARLTAQAVTDTSAWATKTAQALITAAANLPTTAPLDPEQVLAHDAGPALNTTRTTLAHLGEYASLLDTARYVGTIRQLHRLLPLIAVTGVTQEVRTIGGTLNKSALDTTMALRKLEADVRTDVDTALVGVATGQYVGVTLAPITTATDLGERAQAVALAFTTRTATEPEVMAASR